MLHLTAGLPRAPHIHLVSTDPALLESSLLTVSVISILLPAAFHFAVGAQLAESQEGSDILAVSHAVCDWIFNLGPWFDFNGVAMLILHIYRLLLFFSAVRHSAIVAIPNLM